MSGRPPLGVLEARIGHVFADPALLVRALTHVSADARRTGSYQRLEFLGDRVLGLVVADMLCAAFPDAEEGELSRRLAELVRRESCAEVAVAWNVGPHLRLGEAEMNTGGSEKPAILSDAAEAIIGAVFEDAGFPAAKGVVTAVWKERMLSPRRPLRDAKTALQEWAQARGLPTPRYSEDARRGPAHAPEFAVSVTVEGREPFSATGGSKRTAEQAAAEGIMMRDHIIDGGAS